MPSGGTLATVTGLFDHYSVAQVVESTKPWILSPIPGPKPVKSRSLLSKLSGVVFVPDMGTLTTGIAAGPNRAIVERSWGLFDRGNFYGQSFQYREYMSVRNAFVGTVVHIAITIGMTSLAFPPLRWLLKKIVTAPGGGPAQEATKNDFLEVRAIATADQDGPRPQRAFARLTWKGSIYQLSAVFLAEAALVMLREDTMAEKLGGGLLTPATLGQPFVDRLRNAGVIFQAHVVDEQ